MPVMDVLKRRLEFKKAIFLTTPVIALTAAGPNLKLWSELQ